MTKSLAVLGCFTPERIRLSLAAIIAATGVPRATAHRTAIGKAMLAFLPTMMRLAMKRLAALAPSVVDASEAISRGLEWSAEWSAEC